MPEMLWVDRRHPEYDEKKKIREYARDHYTGEVQTHALKAARDMANYELTYRTQLTDPAEASIRFLTQSQHTRYLYPRVQGESGLAFYERARITRYPNHMSTLVDSFVGGVFAVEENAVRTWGDPLGSPEDPDSVAYALMRDIDGSNTNWETRLYAKAIDLIVDGEVWYMADRKSANDPIRIHDIDPDSVVQWREEEGVIVEALIWEKTWEQFSLMQEPQEVEYYVHYTVDGWTRYRVEEEEQRTLVVVEQGRWKYPIYTAPDKRQKRLPLGRVKMPIVRPIGYQMALDANQLYNLLSDARWLYRVLNHPRLKGNVDDGQFERTMAYLGAGANGVQGDWDYISPPHENAASAYQTYREEAREYYIVNHQRANQSAIERSATEILYNEAAGRTAFLSLFAGAIDEFENEELFMASQIEAPNNPKSWLNSTVRRSHDFKPIDIERLADQRANRFAIYANILPTDLALELSGHDEKEVEKFRQYNPVPEEAMFNDGGTEATETAAQEQGAGVGLGRGGLEATLADIADGLGGSA